MYEFQFGLHKVISDVNTDPLTDMPTARSIFAALQACAGRKAKAGDIHIQEGVVIIDTPPEDPKKESAPATGQLPKSSSTS